MKEFIDTYYVERRNTNSLKWDALEERFGNADLLPLWVADMDFRVSDAITEQLKAKIEHGAYGYPIVPDSYYDTLNAWLNQFFGYTIQKDWLRFSSSVVQVLYNCVNTYTEVGDKVLILSPVYYPFFNAIEDTGRSVEAVELKQVDGRFQMDYTAIEEKLQAGGVKLYIHCSPHNPVGRVWTEEEQARIFQLCEQYDVLIVSDEIHQDFVFEGKHTPALCVQDGAFRDRLITAHSASKSFNIAGLTHCHVIIADEALRQKYDAFTKIYVQANINSMGLIATQAAYAGGHAWLQAIKDVIYHNYQFVQQEISKRLPQAYVYPLEGTYLLFINLTEAKGDISMSELIQEKAGLAVDYGDWFAPGYENYIRLNLATKPEIVQEAVHRLIEACLD